tara:strand:+ start:6144 stop:6386 length:243 start_codon:yes stop_codon:yes gene_type:complete
MTTTEITIANTNLRLKKWYAEVKQVYNVIGEGTTRVEGDEVIVDYIENGVSKTWSMAFYPEYTEENGINFVFNCWSEEAR